VSVIVHTFRNLRGRLARRRGQGTVEYVGIVLAVGTLLLALATPMGHLAGPIAAKIAAAVKDAIDTTVSHGKSTP
jgi:hypothetical protein